MISVVQAQVVAAGDTGFTWTDGLNVIASTFSLVLAVVAITLSVLFYKFSDRAQRGLDDSTEQISRSVSQLEELYSRLYSDLFSITKDTVTDMRRQVFGRLGSGADALPPVVASRVAENEKARLSDVKNQVSSEVSRVLEQIASAGDSREQMSATVYELVERAVDRGRSVEREGRAQDLRVRILDAVPRLISRSGAAVADELLVALSDNFSLGEVQLALEYLRDEGLLTWSTALLEPGTIVHLSASNSQSVDSTPQG